MALHPAGLIAKRFDQTPDLQKRLEPDAEVRDTRFAELQGHHTRWHGRSYRQ